MPIGIIYLVKNIVSNKCYVGQTTRTLEIRKKEHLLHTIKVEKNYKFARALRKYPETSWKWSILSEVPVNELDEYEVFFINDLDTFKNGYNTHAGGNWLGETNPRHNGTIYELWHPDHGIIRETIGELCKRSHCFSSHISQLVKGKRHHINGFVLLENKDNYDTLFKKYNFYHSDYGTIECTCSELFNTYRDSFKTKECFVYRLASKNVYSHFGWVLAENKDKYDDLINPSTFITLTHPEHGTLTLKRSEFRKRYNLLDNCMTRLKNGDRKQHKGWTYVSS